MYFADIAHYPCTITQAHLHPIMTAASKQEVLASLGIKVLVLMKKSSFCTRKPTNFAIVKAIKRRLIKPQSQ